MAVWSAGLLLVGIIAQFVLAGVETDHLEAAIARHEARTNPDVTESGRTEPERTPPPGHEDDVPENVTVGVYLDRVPALSTRDSHWTADFYIWFNWTDPEIDPAETFQVVDGAILSRDALERRVDGEERYALYRVVAAITKVFNAARFPRDDHLLTLRIEDTQLQSYQLQYTADTANTDVSSRVSIPGYRVADTVAVVQPHSYRTTRGDPALPPEYRATYSQFTYGIAIDRPTWGLHMKMFVTLFAAVFISLIGFFTTPAHRLGLVVGSFFAAVANTYITSTIVPDTGIATLADVINSIGVITIAVIALQTIISQQLDERYGRKDLSRVFDLSTFAVATVLYLWLNLSIPAAASLG